MLVRLLELSEGEESWKKYRENFERMKSHGPARGKVGGNAEPANLDRQGAGLLDRSLSFFQLSHSPTESCPFVQSICLLRPDWPPSELFSPSLAATLMLFSRRPDRHISSTSASRRMF